jgi:hypothetical protein
MSERFPPPTQHLSVRLLISPLGTTNAAHEIFNEPIWFIEETRARASLTLQGCVPYCFIKMSCHIPARFAFHGRRSLRFFITTEAGNNSANNQAVGTIGGTGRSSVSGSSDGTGPGSCTGPGFGGIEGLKSGSGVVCERDFVKVTIKIVPARTKQVPILFRTVRGFVAPHQQLANEPIYDNACRSQKCGTSR